MTAAIEKMKIIQYFNGCSDEELLTLLDKLEEQTVAKGEVFLVEGENTEYIYFVVSGVVKVYKSSPEGKLQILKIASTGDSINDVSTFGSGPNAASMQAMTPLVLYAMKKQDLEDACFKYPRITLNALHTLANRVRGDSSLVQDLSFMQVTERLAKVLLRVKNLLDKAGFRLTQKDLAAMVGASREVVNRSLGIMEDKGALRLTRHGIIILDRTILEDIVKDFS